MHDELPRAPYHSTIHSSQIHEYSFAQHDLPSTCTAQNYLVQLFFLFCFDDILGVAKRLRRLKFDSAYCSNSRLPRSVVAYEQYAESKFFRRTWFRLARKCAKMRFKQFPTFHFLTTWNFWLAIFLANKIVFVNFCLDQARKPPRHFLS